MVKLFKKFVQKCIFLEANEKNFHSSVKYRPPLVLNFLSPISLNVLFPRFDHTSSIDSGNIS